MSERPALTTIDDYIAGFPPEIQAILAQIRATIRQAVPDAEEVISYQMPTFKLHGNLVHFAAFKRHIGLYPTPGAIEQFKDELARYAVAKGTVRFLLDEPIPYALIGEIARARARENREKAARKRRK